MHNHLKVAARWIGLGLAVSVCAQPVWAVDGVTEVNQTRAVAGGVTSDDTPGFPVTLNHPGSYRLTGNLTVTIARELPRSAPLPRVHCARGFAHELRRRRVCS